MALKTDFKDDIFSGQRKYIQVKNDDGTVFLADATTYLQEGDSFGAAEINATNKAINELNSNLTQEFTVSIPTTGWSSSAPYTQTVTVTGITSDMNPVADVSVTTTVTATAIAQIEAFAAVGRIVTAANSITLYCYEDKPTTAFTIRLRR